MDEIKELLGEELRSEFEALATMTPGSEEHTAAVENLEKLYKLKIEEAKVEVDNRDKENKRKNDDGLRKFNWISLGVQSGLTLAGIIAYNVWYHQGLKFEETGTVRSPMTRNLMSRMLPGKK